LESSQWQKFHTAFYRETIYIYKILEKAFSYNLSLFYNITVFVPKNWKKGPPEEGVFFLEIGHTGYKKIENFILI
jgi:hypothetical protein